MENERVGAAIAFWREGRWVNHGWYLGKNMEVFDAKVFATGQSLEELNEREERDTAYTIFPDSQAALSRVQHDRTGPGQMLAVKAIATTDAITGRGNAVTLRWTPSHEGINGNKQADCTAKGLLREV